MDERVTPDGSPVEVFRRLPPPTILEDVPSGGTVVDLGCGAGRLAHPLAERGHEVVAVDISPSMLAWVRVPRICADIRHLALHARFDTVVLASYLVNQPDGGAFLATCRRHVTPNGAVLVQRYAPSWVAAALDDSVTEAGVTLSVHDFRSEPDRFEAIVTYSIGRRTWHQTIGGALVDLVGLAAAAGLRFECWLDDFETWALLRVDSFDSP
ncbi:MAG: class I SAM-dependent methyltransferase [Acidimicrobiales bacterium]